MLKDDGDLQTFPAKCDLKVARSQTNKLWEIGQYII